MATKARFYEVERQNGHEKWNEFVAAPSKKHIESGLNTPNIKVNTIKSVGWLPVAARPSGDEQTHEFQTEFKGKEFTIQREAPGFKYLTQQFHTQVQDVQKWIKEQD
nr:hypothetical protein [uncultured Noviherbaspirillum sp.]